MKSVITIFLASITTLIVEAQSIHKDNIRWIVSNVTDLQVDENSSYSCQFITYGEDKIEWIQGDYVIVMKVQRIRGKWTNLENNGSIMYEVRLTDKTGTLTFSKDEGVFKIGMKFMDGLKNSTPYRFNVSAMKTIEP